MKVGRGKSCCVGAGMTIKHGVVRDVLLTLDLGLQSRGQVSLQVVENHVPKDEKKSAMSRYKKKNLYLSSILFRVFLVAITDEGLILEGETRMELEEGAESLSGGSREGVGVCSVLSSTTGT